MESLERLYTCNSDYILAIQPTKQKSMKYKETIKTKHQRHEKILIVEGAWPSLSTRIFDTVLVRQYENNENMKNTPMIS